MVQEAGRSGRDGRPARAVLLYRLEDKRVQSFFLGGKYPRREDTLAVWSAVGRAGSAGVSAAEIAEASALPEKRVKVVAAQLIAAGAAERRRRKLHRIRPLEPAELDRLLSEYEERHADDRERLEPGDEVRHRAYGQGKVLEVSEENVVVAFSRRGKHRIRASHLSRR